MGVLLIDKCLLSDGLANHRINRVRSQSANLSMVRDAVILDAVLVAHRSLLDEKKLACIHKGPNDISIASSALSLHLPNGRFSIRGIRPAAKNGQENIVNL